MRVTSQRTLLFIAIFLIAVLSLRILNSTYRQANVKGQPTEVSAFLTERGDYIDVALSIKNNMDEEAEYIWEISFYGKEISHSAFIDTIKSSSSLFQVTSYRAPEDKDTARAEIKIHNSQGNLIEERTYHLKAPSK